MGNGLVADQWLRIWTGWHLLCVAIDHQPELQRRRCGEDSVRYAGRTHFADRQHAAIPRGSSSWRQWNRVRVESKRRSAGRTSSAPHEPLRNKGGVRLSAKMPVLIASFA